MTKWVNNVENAEQTTGIWTFGLARKSIIRKERRKFFEYFLKLLFRFMKVAIVEF